MRNRWLIALAAIGIHISIGSVYAWSVLTRPIMAEMGITLSETTGVFSTAILFLGITTCFLGNFVEKIGPKKSGLLSTAFFALAMFGTYLAISWHTLPLVYLFYGVLGGVGIGIGYMAPVSTIIRYFPHNRGLATGLAIMGFGFATLFAGPTMQQVTATFGIAENFLIMGTLYVAIMLAASLYLKPPADSMACTHAKTLVETGPTAADALKTWQFASLWWVFFVNIACGIALFALAAPMAQDVIGMEPGAAAAMVGLIGLFNGGGRFIWSTVSDYIGRGRMYALFFLMEVIAFWQLGNTRDAFLFQAMIFLITSCSGGGFSVHAGLPDGPFRHAPPGRCARPHADGLGSSGHRRPDARLVAARPDGRLHRPAALLRRMLRAELHHRARIAALRHHQCGRAFPCRGLTKARGASMIGNKKIYHLYMFY